MNLYFFGIFRNTAYVAASVKCWFAKLDLYVNPYTVIDLSITSTNPKSPYFSKPKTYPIGIIHDDYKQYNTFGNGTIDTYCRGNTYVNGIDCSDARKINFEVSYV